MAALTAERDTQQLDNEPIVRLRKLPIKANVKILKGAAVVNDAGYAAPATAATGLLSWGRARFTYDNTSGAAGALTVETESGCFFLNQGTSADVVVQADVGKVAYFVDDQTVSTVSTSRSAAGRIIQLSDDSVQVGVQLGVLV